MMHRESQGEASGTSLPPARVTIVIPCYNEEKRIDQGAFTKAASDPDLRFVFVDDGSTDETQTVLYDICEDPTVGEVLVLARNEGKAEAVRQGVLHAAGLGSEYVGYWDADLATPLDEIPRFVEVLDRQDEIDIVLGSRVNLLGRDVHRKLIRHYIGRVFASMVAAGLSLPVYDSQCGAKLFRSRPETMSLFAEPFYAKWIFDAEILARAIDRHEVDGIEQVKGSTYELPLRQWFDVEGSALRFRDLFTAGRDWVRVFGRHKIMGRFHRGTGGLTFRVTTAVKCTLARMAVDGPSISTGARLTRAVATVPIFGTFVLWSRLRSWLSGPVSYEVEAADGTRFVCRIPDLVQSYIFIFGVWEPDLTAFIRRRMAPNRTFIDIGANVGYHSMIAAKAQPDGGRVVAIEASPDIAAHLREGLVLNGVSDRVTVVNKAVSDSFGDLTIYRGPHHNTGLTTSLAGRGFTDGVAVECAPLDALLSDDDIETARLVKIDVEGAEVAVLHGMTDFLDRCAEDVEILVELSPKWWSDESHSPESVLQPFFDRGFHAYEIDNNLWPWRYLWPNVVRPPQRSRGNFDRKRRRIDLVLSRIDAPTL